MRNFNDDYYRKSFYSSATCSFPDCKTESKVKDIRDRDKFLCYKHNDLRASFDRNDWFRHTSKTPEEKKAALLKDNTVRVGPFFKMKTSEKYAKKQHKSTRKKNTKTITKTWSRSTNQQPQ